MKQQMKKLTLICMLTIALALPSCAPAAEEARLTVVCTTYPIYLFASSITQGVEGVAVERLDTGSTSCLHDYTLSMADMKKLERADMIAINGAGLEEFLEDALAASDAVVIDCSEGIELLENLSHHHEDGEEDHDGHDHGHWDPHYWMDPANGRIMARNLLDGIAAQDSDHLEEYVGNFWHADGVLLSCETSIQNLMMEFRPRMGEFPGLITFHDGFQYFARACDVPLLAAIEEEAGSEASAREIVEITQLVKEYNIPVIFTEVNGSDATAKAISRETGCQIAQLSMVMDSPMESDDLDTGLLNHYFALYQNAVTMINGFAGESVVPKG